MEFLFDLWLPILLATIALQFTSFLCWVVLPHHFADKKKLEHEQEVMDFVKRLKIPPGNYMFPYPTCKREQNDKDFIERYNAGPTGLLDIYEPVNMGKNLGLTFLFFLVTTTLIAYVTHLTCLPGNDGVDFLRVLRVAGTIGVLTHASSCVLHRIWYKAPKLTDILDGVIFGMLIGLIFAAFWPKG